jgi:hypothetical protein
MKMNLFKVYQVPVPYDFLLHALIIHCDHCLLSLCAHTGTGTVPYDGDYDDGR